MFLKWIFSGMYQRMRQHAQQLSERERKWHTAESGPLKPIVWWMEGFTLLGVRTRPFLLLLSPPLMPGGYQSGMTKSKDYRCCVGIAFSKVGKEIRGMFKNSPQCFSQCFSCFSQCPHIVYKSVGHNHGFQLSFVNCGLKPHRLLVVHIIIYVIVIHIHLGSVLYCALPMTINSSIDKKSELIWWKSSFIWVKILNDISCKLNWVPIQQLD